MRMITMAYRNLGRRPARTVFTTLGIAIAVATVVGLVGVAESLESSFLALYERRGADLVVQRRGGAVQLAKGIPLALGDRLRALPEVREVIGGLMDLIAFEDRGLFMVIVNGWEPDCPVLDRVQITAGRRLCAADRQAVMLGKILATNLGVQPGDSLEIYSQPFQVVGVFESFSVYENGAVFMLLEDLQRQMDRPGQVTGFVVQSRAHGDVQATRRLCREIESLDPEVAATPCAEFVNSLNQMQVTRTMSWVTSVIAVAIGAIGVLNTMAMSVLERRSEIGALRAMGWRGSHVLRLICYEAFMLAVAGACLGQVLGVTAMLGLARWHVTSGLIQGDISLRALAEGALLAVLMALLGAAYPAYRGARLLPAAALRGT
jgi:putative ABC transport system permease protein